MDRPDQETMEVLVVIAMPPVETRASEIAWEQSILNAVSAAVHGDKTLNTIAVKPLEYEDCQWVFEGGMPLADYCNRLVATRQRLRERTCFHNRFSPSIPAQ